MKIKLKIPAAAMKSDGKKVQVASFMSDGLKFEHCKEDGAGTTNCVGSKDIDCLMVKNDGSKVRDGLKVKDSENVEVHTDNAGPVKSQSDSDSVKVIEFSSHFSPYKSHLERELTQELLQMEKQKKRSLAIAKWDWDSVIDLGSSKDEDSESELSDTADSSKPVKKVPRISIQRRNRVLKLIDESSEDQ